MKKYQKWMIVLLVALVFVLLFVLPRKAFAVDIPPQFGDYTIGDSPPGEKEHLIEIRIPLAIEQQDHDWRLYASYAWYDKESGKWILVPMDDYSMKTKLGSDSLIGSFSVTAGSKWYWLRVWGKGVISNKWLHLYGNVYSRSSITDKVAYEYLININKKKYRMPVPASYQERP